MAYMFGINDIGDRLDRLEDKMNRLVVATEKMAAVLPELLDAIREQNNSN